MSSLQSLDYSPRIFSKRWFIAKCRPDSVQWWHGHVHAILESGLLFREESALVEDASTAATLLERRRQQSSQERILVSMLTNRKVLLSSLGLCTCMFIAPLSLPLWRRWNFVKLAVYSSIPLAICTSGAFRGQHARLRWLLDVLRDYTALCRRCMACLRDFKLVGKNLCTGSSVVETAETLLVTQQMDLAFMLIRMTAALLANFPWLEEDMTLTEIDGKDTHSDLSKSHHLYLVLQSSFLRHLAMVHLPTKASSQNNHNERLHWLDSRLLPRVIQDVLDKQAQLFRIYKLLKKVYCGASPERHPQRHGLEAGDGHLAQTCTSRVVIQLGSALKRVQCMDSFLDNCWANKIPVDYAALNADFELLSDEVLKCASDIDAFKIKLKKLTREPTVCKSEDTSEITVQNEVPALNCDEEPVIRDQVFYCDPSSEVGQDPAYGHDRDEAADVTTAPGADEIRNSQLVLKPINEEPTSIAPTTDGDSLFYRPSSDTSVGRKSPRHQHRLSPPRMLSPVRSPSRLSPVRVRRGSDPLFVSAAQSPMTSVQLYGLSNGGRPQDFVIRSQELRRALVSREDMMRVREMRALRETMNLEDVPEFPRQMSVEGERAPSDDSVEATRSDVMLHDSGYSFVVNGNQHHLNKEVVNADEGSRTARSNGDGDQTAHTPASSNSEEDSVEAQPLKTSTRNRARRRKNHPVRRASLHNTAQQKRTEDTPPQLYHNADSVQDEGLRPMEYRFGTGMALASMMQRAQQRPLFSEETYHGEGEVELDSGNDEA